VKKILFSNDNVVSISSGDKDLLCISQKNEFITNIDYVLFLSPSIFLGKYFLSEVRAITSDNDEASVNKLIYGRAESFPKENINYEELKAYNSNVMSIIEDNLRRLSIPPIKVLTSYKRAHHKARRNSEHYLFKQMFKYSRVLLIHISDNLLKAAGHETWPNETIYSPLFCHELLENKLGMNVDYYLREIGVKKRSELDNTACYLINEITITAFNITKVTLFRNKIKINEEEVIVSLYIFNGKSDVGSNYRKLYY